MQFAACLYLFTEQTDDPYNVIFGDGPVMDSIVCSIDFSPATGPVCAWAAMIARRFQTRLFFFHAIHFPSDSLHPTTEFERGGRLRRLHEERRAAMDRLMAAVDVPCHPEIVAGEPVEAIRQFCRKYPVGLIVAGSRGIGGLKRLVAGTVAARMAREVACPLLVLHSGAGTAVRIDRIGICCDLPDDWDVRLGPGVSLAQAFAARIDLLHAMPSALSPDLAEPSGAPYSLAQQRMEERLQKQLLALVPRSRNGPVDVSAHLVRGEAHERIPELAADLQIDILQVGVRRRSLIGKWVIGSTTEAVLRKANCHVLTVPL